MQLLEGRQALCSHGLQIRDYLYVEDVGEALAAILDSNVSGAINVASGQPVTLKDLVLQIAGKLGRPELVRFGALPAHEDEPPFVVGDARRLISEVGWIPRIELDKGLERTIAWWRNRTSQEPHVR
jgi:nucleoside-diphosphate-sugar epimerase